MASQNEILEYIRKTPGNTNPAVLASMINQLGGGGGSSDITVVEFSGNFDDGFTADVPYAELLTKKLVIGIFDGIIGKANFEDEYILFKLESSFVELEFYYNSDGSIEYYLSHAGISFKYQNDEYTLQTNWPLELIIDTNYLIANTNNIDYSNFACGKVNGNTHTIDFYFVNDNVSKMLILHLSSNGTVTSEINTISHGEAS